MQRHRLPLVCALLLTSFGALAADANYHVAQRIKVSDGGFDYATFDGATGHVLMTRTDDTTVVDAKTGRVSQLKAGAGHMAVPVAGTSLLVIPQRPNNVRIIDGATDKLVADVPAPGAPDGAVYDPYTKYVWVMGHDGGIATAIDPVGKKAAAQVNVGGTLEFPASDGAGKIYVNVTSTPDIAVIDAKTNMVTAHYALTGCRGASGLAYATQAKVLISSCGNGMAKVIDAASGREVASIPIARGPDAVIYDPVRRIAFIPCGGDGVLEVISVPDAEHVMKIATVPTQAGSRTGTLDPQTGRLYLMASQPDPTGKPGPGGRGIARVPGTYEILVVAP